jgi:hypothetical protein
LGTALGTERTGLTIARLGSLMLLDGTHQLLTRPAGWSGRARVGPRPP